MTKDSSSDDPIPALLSLGKPDVAPPDNGKHIIRDQGARKKKPKPWWRFHEETTEEELLQRFETLPVSAIGSNTSSTSQHGGRKVLSDGKAAAGRVSGANYQQAYLEQKAQEDQERERKIEDAENKRFQEQKKLNLKTQTADEKARAAAAKQEEENLRARARQIQDQIVFWERQRDQTLYSEEVIANTLNDLRRELACIPSNLQS